MTTLLDRMADFFIVFQPFSISAECNPWGAGVWLEYVCVCVVILFILDVRLVDAPAEVTQQEEGHTVFLHLLSGVFALIFIGRMIQPASLSLVNSEVEFCVPTN